MKYCKDCKHFYEGIAALCARPTDSLVYGPGRGAWKGCQEERESQNTEACGHAAQFFEKREQRQ